MFRSEGRCTRPGGFRRGLRPAPTVPYPGLVEAPKYVRAGDSLAVCKLDRLGRSVGEVLTLAGQLHGRGIGLHPDWAPGGTLTGIKPPAELV